MTLRPLGRWRFPIPKGQDCGEGAKPRGFLDFVVDFAFLLSLNGAKQLWCGSFACGGHVGALDLERLPYPSF
jgi:hypothetical protein